MVISVEDVIEMSGVETLHPGGFDLSRRIGELVNFTTSTHVLDVSSGKGVFPCYYAKEFGSRITGIDINPQFVEIARKRAQREEVEDKVDFRSGDSKKLPFQSNEFDVVVNECAVGLNVINDPQQVLNEMARVTRKGGMVVIHESTWLKNLPSKEKEDAAVRMGTTPYTVEEWKQMLKKAGLATKIVEDWSGITNMQKMRPKYKWKENNPSDFLTIREKFVLFPKLILKYGIGPVLDIYSNHAILIKYLLDGYIGYVLITAQKT